MFDNIFIFTQLVEIGAFNLTAQRLNMAPSTVTRKIQKLENYLGKMLLLRDTRNIKLTKDGKLVYLQFKEMRNELSNIYNTLNISTNKKTDTLNIVLPIEFSYNLISPYISTFSDNNPDIKINLYYEFNPDSLGDRDIDIVVTPKDISDARYLRKLIRTETISFYCTPEYADKYGLPNKIEDISNHKLIGGIDPIEKTPMKYISLTNRYTHEHFLLNNLDSSLRTNMALHSLQIGLTGNHIFGAWNFLCANLVKEGRLLHVLPAYYTFSRDIYLYHKGKIKIIEHEFIDLINQCMRYPKENIFF